MKLLLIVVLMAQLAMLWASGRQKRMVLHADTDIIEEIVKMRAEMANMMNILKDHGSTYVRWGGTSCGGGNGTQLIYKGYMAGSYYDQSGNGANHLCLPDNPTWGKYDDGAGSYRSYIYGSEFEHTQGFFGKHADDEDVPCAVCLVTGISVMIPARTACYPGWNVEYSGYLMANLHNEAKSNYICMDGDPEFITRGAANTNGNLLYLVEGRCGALVCPPYFDHRELACSVCSKIH